MSGIHKTAPAGKSVAEAAAAIPHVLLTLSTSSLHLRRRTGLPSFLLLLRGGAEPSGKSVLGSQAG